MGFLAILEQWGRASCIPEDKLAVGPSTKWVHMRDLLCGTQLFEFVHLLYYCGTLFYESFCRVERVINLVLNFYSLIWLLCYLHLRITFQTYTTFSLFASRRGFAVFIVKVYGKLHHQCDVILFGRYPETNLWIEALFSLKSSCILCVWNIAHVFEHLVGTTESCFPFWLWVNLVLGNASNPNFVSLLGMLLFDNLEIYLVRALNEVGLVPGYKAIEING